MSEYRVAEEVPAVTAGAEHAKRRPRAVRAVAGWRRVLGTVAGLLFVASVVKELRTPREQRTWHGVVLGFVPYDLRPPTPKRFQESWWNPASHQLFTSRVFGVGWSLNLHEAWSRLRTAAGAATRDEPTPAAA